MSETVQLPDLSPVPTALFLSLPDREQGLQAIGDEVASWIKWVERTRSAEGLETASETHVMLNGYEGAPPHWPHVGQLLKWLEVIRAGLPAHPSPKE